MWTVIVLGGAVLSPNTKEQQIAGTARKDGHTFLILPQICRTMAAEKYHMPGQYSQTGQTDLRD
jgi:hypothetical protein